MNLNTFVYEKCIQSIQSRNPLPKYFWFLLRKLLIKLFNDPVCRMSLHGRYLEFPLSHAMPMYLVQFPFYDRLPGRLGEYVRHKYGYVKCIDVGANIGDTIASFYQEGADQDKFLAIEPNKKFLKYLYRNWNHTGNVTILPVVCGAKSLKRSYTEVEMQGTASFVCDENGEAIETESLGDIVKGKLEFTDVNILKIDTDGYDFEVIAGASKVIEKNMPVVLFECAELSNPNYVENCLETLKFFKSIGYESFLFYDNFGNLMGRCSLSDLSHFRYLLFYQLTSRFRYFDILLMRSEDLAPFFVSESSYFIDKMPDKSLQRTAAVAIGGVEP